MEKKAAERNCLFCLGQMATPVFHLRQKSRAESSQFALSSGFGARPMAGRGWGMEAGGMKSVLLVEDDNDLRSALGEFLEREGYDVNTARNGSEALLRLEGKKPGLVLLDLMMPVMNGWEFLERKSKTAEISRLPVLVLSAVPGKPYIPGALACLKKPIDLRRLLDFVELYCA